MKHTRENRLFLFFVGGYLIFLTGCAGTTWLTEKEIASWTGTETGNGETIKVDEPYAQIPVEPEISTSPIDLPLERTTKKVFWLQVSPTSSPVSPEKFTGYHAWVDFEIFEKEIESDVEVRALCTGPIIYKKWTSGYGGVVVQSCTLDTEAVTVLYGHLRLESIDADLESTVNIWDRLGILGKGYTEETDNERKHLHIGIHKWSDINLLWYVANSGGLIDWIDPLQYIK